MLHRVNLCYTVVSVFIKISLRASGLQGRTRIWFNISVICLIIILIITISSNQPVIIYSPNLTSWKYIRTAEYDLVLVCVTDVSTTFIRTHTHIHTYTHTHIHTSALTLHTKSRVHYLPAIWVWFLGAAGRLQSAITRATWKPLQAVMERDSHGFIRETAWMASMESTQGNTGNS